MEHTSSADDSALACVNGVWLPATDTHFRAALEKTGGYLPERLTAALSYCRAYDCAVDIGAHVGLYTMRLLRAFQEVWAFEPDPLNYRCLLANIDGQRDNAQARAIQLHNVAMGRTEGRGAVHADPLPKRQGNTGARFILPMQAGPVSLCPLDAFQLPRCDFLKIDVEGMELDVLSGAVHTVTRCKPVIMLEVGKVPTERYGYPVEAPLRFLENLGMQEALRMRGDRVWVWPE